jgi:2-polyprenyl-3-methyl-5-hydroxy-6-metoxy-1,4-benzoquinol methylase
MNAATPSIVGCALCGGREFVPVRTQANGWHIGRCRTCGFVQIIPKPTSRQVAALYDHDWDHFAPYVSQTEIHRRYFNRLIDWIGERTARPVAGTALLDVGCATGVLLEEAGKRGLAATGIDISADAVADCRRRGLSAVESRVSEYAKRPKIPAYDIVTALEVIEHEYDPISMVKSVKSLLKREGIFIVSTPNFDTSWRSVMGNRWVGYQHPEHLWFFTPATLRRLLADAGFAHVDIRADFPRNYEVTYAFRRLADYFPAAAPVLRPVAALTHALKLSNPVNPWGDMLAIARG